VQSTPSGAEIFDAAGTRLGLTPHTLSLAFGLTHTIQLHRPGYQPAEQVILADGNDRTVIISLEPQRRTPVRTKGQKPRPRTSSARTLDPF
jgi:hypothetical protein